MKGSLVAHVTIENTCLEIVRTKLSIELEIVNRYVLLEIHVLHVVMLK